MLRPRNPRVTSPDQSYGVDGPGAHPQARDQGRLPSVRAELLSPVPACRTQGEDTSTAHIGFRCILRPEN